MGAPILCDSNSAAAVLAAALAAAQEAGKRMLQAAAKYGFNTAESRAHAEWAYAGTVASPTFPYKQLSEERSQSMQRSDWRWRSYVFQRPLKVHVNPERAIKIIRPSANQVSFTRWQHDDVIVEIPQVQHEDAVCAEPPPAQVPQAYLRARRFWRWRTIVVQYLAFELTRLRDLEYAPWTVWRWRSIVFQQTHRATLSLAKAASRSVELQGHGRPVGDTVIYGTASRGDGTMAAAMSAGAPAACSSSQITQSQAATQRDAWKTIGSRISSTAASVLLRSY